LLGVKKDFYISAVEFARKFYPRPTVEELLEEMKNSTSFIVGRNPIERLGYLFHVTWQTF
jgi:hypothetical protein